MVSWSLRPCCTDPLSSGRTHGPCQSSSPPSAFSLCQKKICLMSKSLILKGKISVKDSFTSGSNARNPASQAPKIREKQNWKNTQSTPSAPFQASPRLLRPPMRTRHPGRACNSRLQCPDTRTKLSVGISVLGNKRSDAGFKHEASFITLQSMCPSSQEKPPV